MNIIDNNFKESAGIKLAIFRRAIKKSRTNLAEETGVGLNKIISFELGKSYPGIDFLHFLARKYSLNINWILGGEVDMFVKEKPKDVDAAYVKKSLFKNGLPISKEYVEFFQLMEIPEVEKFIFEKLNEVKSKLKSS